MTIKNQTDKPVNRNSKSLLAKCMATENIRVEHDASAETAAFDVKNRVLILPVWKDMTEAMYDMLVGHEVSHALHTPFDEWSEAVRGVKDPANFKQVVNVVEDARIERLIKQRFPGLRRDFANAYAQLADTDLFKIKGTNLSELNLIDRLNIEFKLGLFGLVDVPFSTDEQQIVERMSNTTTFADVVELSRELYEDWNNDQDENESGDSDQQQGDDTQDADGQESDSQESDSGDDQNGQDGSDDSADGEDEGQDSDSSDSTDGEDGQSGQEGQEGTDDSTEDGQDGQSDSNGEMMGDYRSTNGDEEISDKPNASRTQSAFEQGLQDMVDNDAKKRQYHTIPSKMNLDNCILGYKEVAEVFASNVASMQADHDANIDANGSNILSPRVTRYNEAMDKCSTFVASSKSTVNHMVNQFQMKQAADADKRTSVAKTGVLDTTTMVNYRWSEDIFMKNESVADGKNHGMVMFLDWSCSMDSILKDTVEQLLILTEFCNKANIPFEVYAFSSNALLETDKKQSVEASNCRNPLNAEGFTLINFLSSQMNNQEYKLASKHLYVCGLNQYLGPRKFKTHYTPLNQAIMCAMDIVPQFQNAHGVQIVNTVFLTDGDGQSMGLNGGHGSIEIVHDPVTRMDFEASGGYRDETNVYLRMLKARTGCNIVGIRLHNYPKCDNLRWSFIEDEDLASATASYKKDNYCVASPSKTGYDEMFIVRANSGQEKDAFDAVSSDDSFVKIRNAFKKSAGQNKTNKIIATKMVAIFAV